VSFKKAPMKIFHIVKISVHCNCQINFVSYNVYLIETNLPTQIQINEYCDKGDMNVRQ
jgi:hypothetical protein